MSDEFRSYTVALPAIQRGRALGIGGDVEARLARMARRSAPCTSARGNRRYQDYVLTIERGVVTGVEFAPAE